MPTTNDVAIRLLIDGREVDVSMSDLKRKLQETGDAGDTAGKKVGGAFNAIKANYIAIAGALTGILIGINKAIGAASALEEANNKYNVVFRGSIEVANQFRQTLVDSYNLSTRAATQHLASVQDLLVPLGMARDKATEFSGEIVTLAADLGSFNDLPTETVIQDINSALVGNFETMKKYGVVLNETTVKQEALNTGLYTGKGNLDPLAKAQAAYNLIIKGSSDAVGDVARSVGSYAYEQRNLAATVEDFIADIGQELIPAAITLFGLIKDGIEFIKQLKTGWDKLAESLGLATDKLNEYIEAAKELGRTELERKILDIDIQLEELNKQLVGAEENLKNVDKSGTTGMLGLQTHAFAALKEVEQLKSEISGLSNEQEIYKNRIKELNDLEKENVNIKKDNVETVKETNRKLLDAKFEQREAEAAIDAEYDEMIRLQEEEDFWAEYDRSKLRLELARDEENRKLKIKQEADKKRVGLENATGIALSTAERAWGGKSKGLAIAFALINTYQAITKALAGAFPPWNFIQAAAVGALGFQQVSNIRSQSYGVGGLITKPTIALMGEKGAEIVAPKTDFVSVVNNLLRRGTISGRGGAEPQIILNANIDDEGLALSVEKGNKKLTRREY